MKDTQATVNAMILEMYKGNCAQFVLKALTSMDFRLEDLARFFTLSDRSLYSGQNAWLFHRLVTRMSQEQDYAHFTEFVTRCFCAYPIDEVVAMTQREKDEVREILYRDYVHTLNRFVACDIVECSDEVFGCMSITHNDATVNILCHGVDITIQEYSITKTGDVYLNKKESELKMPFGDLIKLIVERGLVNVPESVTTALSIKFSKELKIYGHFAALQANVSA